MLKIINFSEMCAGDACISNISCIKQSWHHKQTYSYSDTPRKSTGLVLALYCSINYHFPNGEIITLPPGSVILLPENSSYYVEIELPSSADISSITINFNISDEVPVTFNEPQILIYKNASKEIIKLFSTLADCYISTSNSLLIKSKLYQLLNVLAVSADKNVINLDTNAPIYSAVKYIENNLNRQISASELAKLCAVSESTLRRSFKAAIGMSPIDYINSLKIKKAKQLLNFPEVTISSLCEQLNFYDASYFYKLFRRYTGMTPIQYRNSTF